MTDVLQPALQPEAATDEATAPKAVQAPLRMTFEQFMAWDPEIGRAEWVDGEVVLVSPASLVHQLIAFFLARLLAAFVEESRLGYVLTAPFLMRLPNRPSGREPDILFVLVDHVDRLKPTYLDGPADLVIEIISPDSEARDRVDKLQEYEAAHIPEYWQFDPLRRDAFFLVLGEDGRYHQAFVDADGVYHSRVLEGFRLKAEWLWRQPLPTVADALRELQA